MLFLFVSLRFTFMARFSVKAVGLFLFFAFLGGCRSFHSVGKTLRAKAIISL